MSSASPQFTPADVIHDVRDKKFALPLPDGAEAHIKYSIIEEGKYDYFRTFGPETWRGKGLPEIVSIAAMDFIKDHHYRVKLSCPYLSKTFMSKHPEYKSVVIGSEPTSKL